MITIINYGTGNFSSLGNIFKNLKIDFQISCEYDALKNSEKYILPGVGSFDNAMNSLQNSNVINLLQEEVINNKKHILGICIGMQILSDKSDEGKLPGIGWIPGEVKKFDHQKSKNLKLPLPHMGWNSIIENPNINHPLFNNIDFKAGFYYLHNYFFCPSCEDNIIAKSNYGIDFTCAIANQNIYGVQFHPEKSHDNGIQFLKNFALL